MIFVRPSVSGRDVFDDTCTTQSRLTSEPNPAVDSTKGSDADATCKANVANVVRALRNSDPVLREAVHAGTLQVIGAYYDLDTGAVQFLDR